MMSFSLRAFPPLTDTGTLILKIITVFAYNFIILILIKYIKNATLAALLLTYFFKVFFW